MATVESLLRLPIQDIVECPVVLARDVPVIEAAVDTILAKCLYCVRVQRSYPLEVLLSVLLQCTLSPHSQLGLVLAQRSCVVSAAVASIVPPSVAAAASKTAIAPLPTRDAPLATGNGNAQPPTLASSPDMADVHMTCVHALCGLTAALLSRAYAPLRREMDVMLFLDVLQRFCADAALKERLGAAHLCDVLVDFVYDCAQHVDDHRVARGCASALITLLRGSRANKSRVAGLAAAVAACVQRSHDVFLQMQCVEVLMRLHTFAPTLLAQTTMDAQLRRGVAALPNDATLLLRMRDVCDAYNAVHHVHDVVSFAVVRIEAADGAVVCGPTRLYFSPLLLVALLPGSSAVDGDEDAHTHGSNSNNSSAHAAGAASSSSGGGGARDEDGNSGFTIPYEDIRSVKLTRDRVLLLRLHVVPDALSSLLQPCDGHDTLHVYLTPSSLAALRASNVHAWIAQRKRTHAPTRQTSTTAVQGQTGPLQTSSAHDEACSPRERSDGHTAPPSRNTSPARGEANAVRIVERQANCITASHRHEQQQQQSACSGVAECASDTSRIHRRHDDDDKDEEEVGDTQQQQQQQQQLHFALQQPALLDAVHHAAAVRARRLHEQQLHSMHTVTRRVHEELTRLQQSNATARDALQRLVSDDLARIRDAEAALRQSAADHVTELNDELAQVQQLGTTLQAAAEALRVRLQHATDEAADVEATRLVHVKRLVDAQMQDMHATLYALLERSAARDATTTTATTMTAATAVSKAAAAASLSSPPLYSGPVAGGDSQTRRPQPKARRLDFS